MSSASAAKGPRLRYGGTVDAGFGRPLTGPRGLRRYEDRSGPVHPGVLAPRGTVRALRVATCADVGTVATPAPSRIVDYSRRLTVPAVMGAGSSLRPPARYSSTARAAARPSAMAQTMSD